MAGLLQGRTQRERGLQASQHAQIHPSRQQNLQAEVGTQGGRAGNPASHGYPKLPTATPYGPQGHKHTEESNKVSNIIEGNLTSLTASIQEALDSYQAQTTSSLLPLLQRAQQALLHQAQTQALTTTLQSIQKTIQRQQTHTTVPQTWAQRAAQIPPTMPRLMPQATTAISVRMGSQKERDEVKGMTGKELREKLGIQQVAAVQKLPSGDLRVLLNREQERTKMEENQEWLQAAWPEAKVDKPLYKVLIHGVRASWNIRDKASWKKLEEENATWFPFLRIEQAAWLKSAKAREGKRHSTAIIGVQEEATARAIAQKGFILEANYLTTEIYHPQQRTVQCMKCSQFGHLQTYCRETKDICGTCSGSHRTTECTATIKKCSNCRGDHASWSRVCKYKQAAIAKARTFSEYFLKKQGNHTYQRESEGYTTVSSKKRKPTSTPEQLQAEGTLTGNQEPIKAQRAPGRPKGTTQTAMIGRKQNNKVSSYIQSSQYTSQGNQGEDPMDTINLEAPQNE